MELSSITYFGCEKHVILHLYIFPFNGVDYYLNFRVMKFQDLRLFGKTNMLYNNEKTEFTHFCRNIAKT